MKLLLVFTIVALVVVASEGNVLQSVWNETGKSFD